MLCLTDLAGADLTSDVRRAMRGDDPVGELRAARSAIADADRKQRNAAAAAIEKSLKKEGDPTVRRAAIDFLLALRTDRSLDRVVAGAVDRYDDVRQHVRFLVRDHADPAFHDAIVRGLEEDSSWRFRAAMV
ncbi:MAG: hypothetical protein ACYSUN_13860, partial [Planctomycetota bacterium]